jgi:hypothetical protein
VKGPVHPLAGGKETIGVNVAAHDPQQTRTSKHRPSQSG